MRVQVRAALEREYWHAGRATTLLMQQMKKAREQKASKDGQGPGEPGESALAAQLWALRAALFMKAFPSLVEKVCAVEDLGPRFAFLFHVISPHCISTSADRPGALA